MLIDNLNQFIIKSTELKKNMIITLKGLSLFIYFKCFCVIFFELSQVVDNIHCSSIATDDFHEHKKYNHNLPNSKMHGSHHNSSSKLLHCVFSMVDTDNVDWIGNLTNCQLNIVYRKLSKLKPPMLKFPHEFIPLGEFTCIDFMLVNLFSLKY